MKPRQGGLISSASIASFLLVGLLGAGIAAAQSVKASTTTLAPGKFQLKLSKDYLSLEAKDAPIAKIFEEIGKQAGIAVDGNISLEEKITIQMDRVPLEEAIKRLVKNVSIFYMKDPKEPTPRIARVVIVSEGKSGAPQLDRDRPSQKAATVKETAPPAQPFKFEFDPTKFVGKEKRS